MLRSFLLVVVPSRCLAGAMGLLLACGLQACASGPKTSALSMEQLNEMAAARYEVAGSCQPNADESLFLCTSGFLVKETMPGVKFFVYSQAENQIIYEQTDTCETVQWHDADHVRVTTLSGIVQQNSSRSGDAHLIEVSTGLRKTDV